MAGKKKQPPLKKEWIPTQKQKDNAVKQTDQAMKKGGFKSVEDYINHIDKQRGY